MWTNQRCGRCSRQGHSLGSALFCATALKRRLSRQASNETNRFINTACCPLNWSTYAPPIPQKVSDASITSAYDVEGQVEVVHPDTKLCRHSATPYAHGLPHVLRLVSRDGEW